MTTRSGPASAKTRCSTGPLNSKTTRVPSGPDQARTFWTVAARRGAADDEERHDDARTAAPPLATPCPTPWPPTTGLCLPTFHRLFNAFLFGGRGLRLVIKRPLTKRRLTPRFQDESRRRRLTRRPPARRDGELERQVAARGELRRPLGPLDGDPAHRLGEPIAQPEVLELLVAAQPIEIEMDDREPAADVLLEQACRSATARGPRSPKPRSIARTQVVLPLPRSPRSPSTSGQARAACSARANAAASAANAGSESSSAISSGSPMLARCGNRSLATVPRSPSFAAVVPRQRVQQHARPRRPLEIARLHEQRTERAGENIARAAGRHAGIAAVADAERLVGARRGDERVRSFQYRDRAVPRRKRASGRRRDRAAPTRPSHRRAAEPPRRGAASAANRRARAGSAASRLSAVGVDARAATPSRQHGATAPYAHADWPSPGPTTTPSTVRRRSSRSAPEAH